MPIPTKTIKEKRQQFNLTLTYLFTEFQKTNKLRSWPINPNAYLFFSYYDEKEKLIIKLICDED